MLSFYTIDPNLNEKISFRRFYRKVSTVNFDQEETRDSLTETRRGEFRRRECMVLDWSNSSDGELDKTDPTRQWASWKWSIQLAIGRVGRTTSNSPNGELDRTNPTRHWAIWMSHFQLTQWRVGSVLWRVRSVQCYVLSSPELRPSGLGQTVSCFVSI